MKVNLILPIATLSGKLSSDSDYYFRTLNGKTFVQHCPVHKTASKAQKRACSLFAERAKLVAQMQREGSKLSQKELWKLTEQMV